MTIVNSPRNSVKRPNTSEIGPLTNSSCSFVNSRPTAICRSPTTRSASFKVSTMRWGASKNTTVRVSARRASSQVARALALAGGKPTKTKASVGSPDDTRAASTALGPGIASTRIPAASAAWTSRNPGSETAGVPASDTRAMEPPSRSFSTSAPALRCSLCSCMLVVGVRISKWCRSFAVWRVSSAAIRSHSRSTRSARSVMSSRLPMGVATRYRIPAVLRTIGGRVPAELLYHYRLIGFAGPG